METMKSFLAAHDLNIRSCALEGSEILGPTKKKFDLLLGSKFDSHYPNKVNYSIPYPIT
jgi:hypothetical protein